jgi:O-acetyl-ADP-ribose deacetylase (regulator of RNase III)
MSKLKQIDGDLLTLAYHGNFDIIVHGCNCFNVFGSGIAKQIKERYPEAYAADQETDMDSIHKLGNFSMAKANGDIDFLIVNAYTQFGYNSAGRPVLDRFEYESFRLILRKLSYTYGKSRFGFPMIGMGLVGGRPQKIINTLQEFALDVEKQGGTVTMVRYV